MTTSVRPLQLSRAQILAHRRAVQALDVRLPPGATSLRQAAWAGLQDSMPRAALLSIHARVEGTEPSTWEDPSLVQLWGPRFSAYVVARRDLAAFTLGRWPDDARGRRVAEEMAARMREVLGDRRMPDRRGRRGAGRRQPDPIRGSPPARSSYAGREPGRRPSGPSRPPTLTPWTPGWSSPAATCTSSEPRRRRHSPSGRASERRRAAPRSTRWADR